MNIKTLTLKNVWLAGAVIALAATVASADAADAPGTDVMSLTRGDAQFSTLTKAIDAAGLADVLAAQGPMTVFAPTDEAFAKLPPAELEALMKPENKEKLAKILTYHVVPGKALETEQLKKQRSTETAAGEDLKVALVNGRLRVGDARVGGDIDASNGVIHAIDRVLLPK